MARHSTAERPSPFLAAAISLASVGVVAAVYWTMYTTSAGELARAKAAHAQIAWVAAAEPDWRKEYGRRLEALKVGSGFFVASKPQEAAGEFQSRLRQALAGAGASVDSLQSSTAAPIEGKLPVIRAVATARIGAAQAIDVLQAVEAIQPRVALESVDIAIQTTGSPQAPERIALITIAARAYVMVSDDALN
jgi:hypothetical protein